MKQKKLFILTAALVMIFVLAACDDPSDDPPGEVTRYTVSFESNGGSAVNSQTVSEGEKAARPNNPVKDNFTFNTWYSDADLHHVYDFDTPVMGNITLYAKWLTPFTVSFDSNGGSDVPEQLIGEGNQATRPQNPSKTGFGFAGWFTDEALTIEYDFDTPVTGDITLYAAWDDNYYTVSFDSMGGSEVDSQDIAHNGTAVPPEDPEYSGFGFYGWYIDIDYTEEYDFDSPVTEEITLYAKWGARQFTITFDTRGGSEVPEQLVAYGVRIERPEDPTNSFYSFSGWYKDEELTQSFSIGSYTYFYENEDITLYAKWGFSGYEFRQWLIAQEGGDTPDNPIDVMLTNELGSYSYEVSLLTSLGLADKYVMLDLSTCTTTDNNIRLLGIYGGNVGMKKVVSLILPDTITSVTIGEDINNTSIFNNDDFIYTNLKSVSGKNVENIGDYVFYRAFNLEYINFPKLKSIGDRAFYSIGNNYNDQRNQHITELNFPLVETIGSYAFTGFTALKEVNFPEAISIGFAAFGACFLLETLNFPKVEIIAESAFHSSYGRSSNYTPNFSLKEAVFPKAVTIGGSAFHGCIKLESLYFPEALTIGGYAFNGYVYDPEGSHRNYSLATLDFPKVTEIGDGAFYGCPELQTLNFPKAKTIGSNVFDVGLYVGDMAVRNIVLTSVSFPEVTHIGYCAFQYCDNLQSIDFPKLEIIEVNAFDYCPLVSITIPANCIIHYDNGGYRTDPHMYNFRSYYMDVANSAAGTYTVDGLSWTGPE